MEFSREAAYAIGERRILSLTQDAGMDNPKPNNEQFVQAAYRLLLGRAPDPAGLSNRYHP
jgi:hypothetical protein